MTVNPTSYEALVVDYAINQLANCATWWGTICAAVSGPASLSRIVNGFGGSPQKKSDEGKAYNYLGNQIDLSTGAYAVVNSEDFLHDEEAEGTYNHQGTVLMAFEIPIDPTLKPNEVMVQARNYMGAIRDEFTAQFGTAGRLYKGNFKVEGPKILSSTGPRKGSYEFMITVKWRA